MSISKIHRQNLKNILIFSTKQIIFRAGGQNIKIILEFFFFYFIENYSRRVHKSTNQKILALVFCILLNTYIWQLFYLVPKLPKDETSATVSKFSYILSNKWTPPPLVCWYPYPYGQKSVLEQWSMFLCRGNCILKWTTFKGANIYRQ